VTLTLSSLRGQGEFANRQTLSLWGEVGDGAGLTYNSVMEQMGRLLIVAGVVLAVLGALFMLGPRLPFRLGRLPLDFRYQRDNFTFYFPLGTCILISVLLTLIFGLLNRR
jgi:membrane associated rhomboid family serine protease